MKKLNKMEISALADDIAYELKMIENEKAEKIKDSVEEIVVKTINNFLKTDDFKVLKKYYSSYHITELVSMAVTVIAKAKVGKICEGFTFTNRYSKKLTVTIKGEEYCFNWNDARKTINKLEIERKIILAQIDAVDLKDLKKAVLEMIK